MNLAINICTIFVEKYKAAKSRLTISSCSPERKKKQSTAMKIFGTINDIEIYVKKFVFYPRYYIKIRTARIFHDVNKQYSLISSIYPLYGNNISRRKKTKGPQKQYDMFMPIY